MNEEGANGRSPQARNKEVPTQSDDIPAVVDPQFTPEQIARILNQRAAELAKLLAEEVQGKRRDVLRFQLGEEHYGIDVTRIGEIFPLQPITTVPRTPPFVVGIFSARGRLISVLDLRLLLGLSATEIAGHTHIIVLNVREMEIAFLADQIDAVHQYFQEDIEPPLAAPKKGAGQYIEGIAPGNLAIIDVEAIFDKNRLIIDEELNE